MTQPSPAGWYPDPSGAAGQRYFDGGDWTAHYAPAVQPVRENITMSGPNHALHAIITICTCGFWAPVWAIIAVLDSRKVRVTRY